MPKAKRARPSLPDWAKNPDKYQYKEGVAKYTPLDIKKRVDPFKVQVRIQSGTGAGSYPKNK